MTTHRSFSQLVSYAGCGMRYKLERIDRAPSLPSWAQVGGKALHAAAEYVNYGGDINIDCEDVWHFFWDQAVEESLHHSGIESALWRASGRKSKEWPTGEDEGWWHAHGPRMVWDYTVWVGGMEDQGWEIAELPDGRMAIEVDLSIGGIVPVKAFADVVFSKGHDHVPVDIKTGRKPSNGMQLGLYARLYEILTQQPVTHGMYYLAREGVATVPDDLSRFTWEWFTDTFHALDKGITAGVFLPNVGPLCGSCGVNRYCAAFGGDLVFPQTRFLEGTNAT